MIILKDAARRLVVGRRRASLRRPQAEMGDPELRQRIDTLGDWFQNIDINGTPTKVQSSVGEPLDYPGPGWSKVIRPSLPNLTGKTVLDIGCNAGFYSIEAKRLGARSVLGVDINQARPEDCIAQARFAAAELGLDVEYRVQDFMDVSEGPFDVVLFMGVLYHLDDPIAGLRKAAELTRSTIVLETLATPGRRLLLEHKAAGWNGDATSPWAPTPALVDQMLMELGFRELYRPVIATRTRYVVVAHR